MMTKRVPASLSAELGPKQDDDSKPDQTGAELVVRGLEAPFGIPGAEIDAVFASLVDPTIKPVAILSNP